MITIPHAPETPSASAPSVSPRTTESRPALFARFGLPLLLLLIGIGIGVAGVRIAQAAHGVVATVNGVPIRDQAFYHRLEVASGPQVLQQMVSEEMQIQFAAKEGVSPTDAQVEAKLDQARAQPNFAKNLAASRQTEDDLRHSLLASLSQANVMTKGITVTDADVRAFYAHNTDPNNPAARYYTPQAVQIAVIVTPTPQACSQAIASLAAGQPFAQTAAQDSKDPSAANGGLLPPLLRGRSAFSKIPKLEAILFKMQVGQQLNGAKIGNSYWIIRCVGTAPAATKPFAAVQDEARLGAMLEKGLPINGPAMQQAFAAFQRTSQVKVLWPQYQSAGK